MNVKSRIVDLKKPLNLFCRLFQINLKIFSDMNVKSQIVDLKKPSNRLCRLFQISP